MPVIHRPRKQPPKNRVKKRQRTAKIPEPKEKPFAQMLKESRIPRAEAFRTLYQIFVADGMPSETARKNANAELDKYYKKKK